MSYILLKDKNKCPRCQAKIALHHHGHCWRCNMRLFIHCEFNFSAFEEDGNLRIYWAWTNNDGWKHRDYIMNLRAEAQKADEKIEQAERNTKKLIQHEI